VHIRDKYNVRMNDYLIGIGKRIKDIRKASKKTISSVASDAEVSNGLISRIENGRTIPSLPVLLNIINALEITVSAFFEGMPKPSELGYIISRCEENATIEKEDEAKGFSYKYIFGKQLSSIGFEAVLLEVQPNSQREKVETDAYEFKYMLSGECYYTIGDDEVLLKEGDSLFFDGRIPHVPINKGQVSAKMLVLYFFLNTQKE
jgi:transcriptional regulator with XRE-family HTH domain